MKMLIVDDHPIERKTISYLVNNTNFDIETITKENGAQALEYLKKNKVDILFTDIKMPFMDGLELIEQALELQSNIKAIIFSGYGEFDYAKKAISMGVNAYLLKPLVKKEFYKCLNNVINEIENENSIEHYAAEKTIIDFIYGRYGSKSELSKTIFQDIWGNNARYSLVLIRNNTLLSYDQYLITKEVFNNIFQMMIPIAEGEYLLVIVNKESENTDNLILKKAGEFIAKNFLSKFKDVSVIFSPFFSDITECKKQYNNIQLLLSATSTIYSIPIDKPIVPFSDTDYTMSYTSLIKWFFESNLEYLESSNSGNSKQILIFSMNVLCAVTKDVFKNLLPEYVKLIYASNLFDDNSSQAIEKAICESNNSQKVNNLLKGFMSDIDRADDNIEDSLNGIKAYIRKNLHSDLSLGSLAKMINYSPNYLCSLFSSNINMTITQYITQQRMEKAKALLANSNMKVKEIAAKVGYSNTSYFNRIFKNYTGNTPKEYKGYV